MHQQMLLHSSPLFRDKLQPQKQAPVPIKPIQEKLFGRATYHVAIAYHIHLKKIKEKSDIPQETIDPTYHAKKLRTEQERGRTEE